MLIPVCNISQYGMLLNMQVAYDTSQNKFVDQKGRCDRTLPIQDYISCSITNNNICTLVGHNAKEYVVCFGDNMLYSVSKNVLHNYTISNAHYDSLGRIRCADKLVDLQKFFPDKNIKFGKVFSCDEKSSLGEAKKFFGTYMGKPCVVKMSKSDDKDILNERSYYEASLLLGVKCCEAIVSIYYGKKCCISIYDYDINKDIFRSFKSLGGNFENVVSKLSKKDRIELDKMLIFDFIFSQQDRHMSNIALINNNIYSMFDNGECLGIGVIGHFSSMHRRYVKNLDKNYIKKLLPLDKLKELSAVHYYNKEICLNIIKNNIRELLNDNN